MNTKNLKPGDWIEVYRNYRTFEGEMTSGWRKATFIRMVGTNVIAKTGLKDPSNEYKRWRLIKKEKANEQ